MNTEEITASLQKREAETFAIHFALSAVIQSIPGLAEAVRAEVPTMRDVSLWSSLTEAQRDYAETLVRLACGSS